MRQEASELTVTRQGHFVVTQNKQFQIKFNISKGTWNYIDPSGHTIIRNAYARVVLQDGTVLSTFDNGVREFITNPPESDEFGVYQRVTFSHQAERKGVRTNLYLNCYNKAPYIILSVGVENLNDEPIALDGMTLIGVSPSNKEHQGAVNLGGPPAGYRLFLNMNHSSDQGMRAVYDGFETTTQAGYDGVLYDTESQKSLVFGFLSFQKWWSAIKVGYNSQVQSNRNEPQGINQWSLYHRCEQHLCHSGQEIESEPVYLNFSGQASESYQLYAEMLAKRMNAHKLEHVFSGWSACPTDDQKQVNAGHILRQVDKIVQTRLFGPHDPNGAEYIHLEDGWQQSTASHEVHSENFPNGVKRVVDGIHSKGLKAGIRFAPFSVALNSVLVQQHPDYFLQDRAKKPATVILPEEGAEVALLDVSHPGAQAYIREYIHRIIDEWECDLVKADLLGYTIGPMTEFENFNWNDESLTVVELYRQGIQLLNQAVAESQRTAILSVCNTANGPSVGGFSLNHLSNHRVYTGKGLWDDRTGLKQLISTSIPYLPIHDTMWTNEFGVLAVDEPLPINEVIVAITAAALSGGVVTCGDDLTTLKSARAKLLGKLFPLVGEAATPIALYQHELPQVWNLRLQASYDSWNVVAVFNWNDTSDEAHLTLASLGLDESKYYLVHDFWDRQYLGVVRGSITLMSIPPRSAKLLCLRAEQSSPQLLATDIHFTQGGVEILSAGWDAKSQSFLIVCKPPRHNEGTLFIHVPENYIPATVSCYGASYQFNWKQPIYELTFNPATDLVHASIRFSQTSG